MDADPAAVSGAQAAAVLTLAEQVCVLKNVNTFLLITPEAARNPQHAIGRNPRVHWWSGPAKVDGAAGQPKSEKLPEYQAVLINDRGQFADFGGLAVLGELISELTDEVLIFAEPASGFSSICAEDWAVCLAARGYIRDFGSDVLAVSRGLVYFKRDGSPISDVVGKYEQQLALCKHEIAELRAALEDPSSPSQLELTAARHEALIRQDEIRGQAARMQTLQFELDFWRGICESRQKEVDELRRRVERQAGKIKKLRSQKAQPPSRTNRVANAPKRGLARLARTVGGKSTGDHSNQQGTTSDERDAV